VAQLGAPLEVYDRPADQFVGGFLGSPPMNFLTATVRDSSLAIGDATLPAPDHLSTWEGRDVVVGVRAENIQVSPDAQPGWVPARVEVVEPTGAALLLTVRLADEQLKVQAPATFPASPDTAVHLRAAPSALRFYDPSTGLALATRTTATDRNLST
jgi:multiple sugar transport system ATP-binding protein